MQQDSKLAADQYKADWQYLMNLPQFRRVLWRVMERSGVDGESWTGNSTTFYNEGKRNMGIWLRSEAMAFDRNNYINMIKENL